jgi:hypothetical protein
MYLMAAVLQTNGEVSDDRLGTAELRLSDPRHQRSDDGNPHQGRIL